MTYCLFDNFISYVLPSRLKTEKEIFERDLNSNI